MGNLNLPKHTTDTTELMAAFKIYYDLKDRWVQNDEYKQILKKVIGDDQYDSSYTKKAQPLAYFGFILRENSKKQSPKRISQLGIKMYEALLANDQIKVNSVLMESLKTISFGRNNPGTDSNSDIEAPNVLCRAILELGYITKGEFSYLISGLVQKFDDGIDFTDLLNNIRKSRENHENLKAAISKYNDPKIHKLLINWNFLVENDGQISFSLDVRKRYMNELRSLPIYNIDKVKKSTNVNVKNVNVKNNSIKAENIIYYGAPGTGKSHDLINYINEKSSGYAAITYTNDTLEKAENVFRITLYPEYEYSDFVGQLLPTKNADFEYKKGIFIQALSYAQKNLGIPVFLILEEMSRANVAAVFGDLFQLLDRKNDGSSEYTINNSMIGEMLGTSDRISLPSNLFILGTVNTSDQNVFVMDTAFKRRFRWKYKSTNIDVNTLNDAHNNPTLTLYQGAPVISWYDFYTQLNEFITDTLEMSEDKQIGPFFIKFNDDDVHELIRDKLLQYLWEDVELIARNSYINDSQTLFDSSIKSFPKLYTTFNENKNIFSNTMLKKLKLEKDDNNGAIGD